MNHLNISWKVEKLVIAEEVKIYHIVIIISMYIEME